MCPSHTSPRPFSSRRPSPPNQHPPCAPETWWTLRFRLRYPSWTQYFHQSNSPYLVDASGQEFKEFDFVSGGSQEGQLSIFSLLDNANSKLQAAKKRGDFPGAEATHYILLIEGVTEQIFFVPRQIQKQIPPLTPLVPQIPSGEQSDVPAPRRSTRSCRGRGDGGLADEEHPDLDAEPEYSDNCSEGHG